MSVLSWLGIQPKQFRYTLTVGATSYVLPNAPIGWEEGILRWSRSEFYYGMIRSFTVPLKFVLDGAWILRTQFYTKGLKAQTSLLIEELVPETWAYQTVFFGDMDYSTFQDSLNEVGCVVMEGGITAQIKAYEGIQYTIPLDVAEAIDVELTPLKLNENAQFILTPYTYGKDGHMPGLQLVVNEPQATVSSVQAVTILDTGILTPDFSNSDKWFYEAQIDTDIDFRFTAKGNGLAIFIYDSNNVQVKILNLGLGPFDIDTTFSLSALAGEKLFLYVVAGPLGGSEGTFEEGEMTLNYFTGSPATTCKAIRGSYLFSELLKRMNNGTAVPYQSGLLTVWNDLVFTSGNAIRGLDNPTLITSFKDFFTSINAVLNAGFGIESGKAILEQKSYFFKSNLQAANVGENKAFELELYEPYVYNSVKIGYPDQKFATIVDNKDEVNSTQIWSLPIVRVQRELDLLSVYRADPYGIEDTRITPVGSSNTNNDNDVFMIKIIEPVSGEFQPERTEGYISLTGVIAAETYYNYNLSPHRNLERHGDYLHSILDKYDAYAIVFESALKNAAMSVVYNNGQRTTENANISIGTLPAKFFLPYLITIITKLPKNMMTLIDSFPTGYIRSRFWENEQNGYTIDTTVDVSKNTERELKLLLTPNNDLENLIH